MRAQLDLFSSPVRVCEPPAQRHSQTSTQSAERIAPCAGTLRRRVLDYLLSCGRFGATDEEIQTALALNPSTQRPRRIELVDAGLVADSARTRRTRSGRNASVWIAL